MPDGATLINTARGVLVDTAALEREASSGRLFAVLDVTDPEPLPASSVLYDLPNVMLTPHIAGSLGSEARRMSEHTLDELARVAALRAGAGTGHARAPGGGRMTPPGRSARASSGPRWPTTCCAPSGRSPPRRVP